MPVAISPFSQIDGLVQQTFSQPIALLARRGSVRSPIGTVGGTIKGESIISTYEPRSEQGKPVLLPDSLFLDFGIAEFKGIRQCHVSNVITPTKPPIDHAPFKDALCRDRREALGTVLARVACRSLNPSEDGFA